MNLNNQELQTFFETSPLGRNIMALAKERTAKFEAGLNEIRGNISNVQANIDFVIYGNHRNLQALNFFDGNPVIATTNNRSKVINVEPVTNENFKDLPPEAKQAIREASGVVYQRLAHGKFEANTSDKYFELLDKAEQGLNYNVLNAYATMKEPQEAGYSQQFENKADMEAGVLGFHRWYDAMTSTQNLLDLNRELHALNEQLSESIRTNELQPLNEIMSFGQGGNLEGGSSNE